ncbi:hypothetical protein TRFO_34302 [Tritrichomonas foetus]|uniref:F5/8 type C domain-containing protein n=1 Tax=Tritrichomonas foetus TaxID=1144522 RepID=A0A1J4JJG3_9EUKA|nr:hypothetical protein TRFO_34302 [Tritrichomonas foetus]|eukprot:OHS99298.1 hypothetical protein TRFO_34302 [Tritrichomonas foetus]
MESKLSKSLQEYNWNFISYDNYKNDFTFIVNGDEYQTTRFLADLISQKVNSLHLTDQMIDYFEVTTKYKGDFQKILDFPKLMKVDISNNDETKYFIDVMQKLGNNQFLENFIKYEDISEGNDSFPELTVSNVFKFLRLKRLINKDLPIQKELIFIAEHLFEIENAQEILLKEIDDCDLLYFIFSHENLCIESETWLLRFVIRLIDIDKRYLSLFDLIELSALDENGIIDFVEFFDVSNINIGIWKSVCARMLMTKSSINNDNKIVNMEELNTEKQISSIHLDLSQNIGIIEHLNNSARNGNVVTNGSIEIRSSTLVWGSLESVIDQSNSSYFGTLDEPNQWLLFDFKDKTINISHYKIKTINIGSNELHLRNWILECSENGNDWVEIDRQKNNSDLNQRNEVHVFQTNNRLNAKLLRLKQIGSNWGDNNYLCISYIDFFGDLYY